QDVSLDQLISYTAGSRVRTSTLQVVEKAWKESEADFFSRSCAWPKKSSPSSYSLKMYPQLPVGGDGSVCMLFPRWGMIVAGVLYPLRPLERYTNAKGGSYWPTPQACDAQKGPAKEYVRNGKQSSMRNLVTM